MMCGRKTTATKKAQQIAMESMGASDKYKSDHDIKAKPHNLMEGDYVFLDNQLFLGKKKLRNQGFNHTL
jgi:hypothetical protein